MERCDNCGGTYEEKVYTDMVHRIIFCPVCHNKKIIGILSNHFTDEEVNKEKNNGKNGGLV